MKKDEILSNIKKDIEINTPDILSKIDFNSIEIDNYVENTSTAKKNFFNLKVLIPITSFVAIFFVLFSVFYKTPIKIINNNIKVTNKDLIVANYTSQALDMVNFNDGTLLSMNYTNQYIPIFEKYSILLQQYLELTEVKVEIYQTNNTKYPYTMEVDNIDFFGNKSSYTLKYYEKRKIDDDEVQKKMNGIIIINDVELKFKVEQETESDEEEVEVIITTKEGYQIEIEKEIELDEYTMEYVIKDKKRTILEVILEVEEDEIILMVNDKKTKYQFDIINIEDNIFKVEINKETFYLKIDKVNKTFEYLQELSERL